MRAEQLEQRRSFARTPPSSSRWQSAKCEGEEFFFSSALLRLLFRCVFLIVFLFLASLPNACFLPLHSISFSLLAYLTLLFMHALSLVFTSLRFSSLLSPCSRFASLHSSASPSSFTSLRFYSLLVLLDSFTPLFLLPLPSLYFRSGLRG